MRAVRAFLTMPDSEASYNQHIGLIDVVLPNHGGALQADGTWEELEERIDNDFARSLPATARTAGQRYIPHARMEPNDGSRSFLDSPELWGTAADNLDTLATTR